LLYPLDITSCVWIIGVAMLLSRRRHKALKYPNLFWALSQFGSRYKFAATIDRSESWLSRRLKGRVEFSPEDQRAIAGALGYPVVWLFEEPKPPARLVSPDLGGAGTQVLAPRRAESEPLP
jgi:transcriptional regulator with XRE-family HTH domain